MTGQEARTQLAALGVTQAQLAAHCRVTPQRVHYVLRRPDVGEYWAALLEQALAHFARLRTEAARPHLSPAAEAGTAGVAAQDASPATSQGSEE